MYLIERGVGSYLSSGITIISVNRPSHKAHKDIPHALVTIKPLKFTMLPGFSLEATI